MDDLLRWRAEFPILERCTHLVSHSLGAMPRGVYDRLHEYAATWDARGVRADDELDRAIDAVREVLDTTAYAPHLQSGITT